MLAIINSREHEVIYIEYGYDKIPHQVYTIETQEGYTHSWDFFANNGDKNNIYFYHSGSGYKKNEIKAPNWVDKGRGSYWIGNNVKIKGKSNGIRLDKPLRIKGYYTGKTSINPFKVSEETHRREYCEKCGQESIDFCDIHKYVDEKGNDRWKDNKEYCV